MAKILIVEDEKQMADFINLELKHEDMKQIFAMMENKDMKKQYKIYLIDFTELINQETKKLTSLCPLIL